MNGYGQFFLLLTAIGMIFLATSGKGLELLNVLKGNTLPYGVTGGGGSGTTPKPSTPSTPKKPNATGNQEPMNGMPKSSNPTDFKQWQDKTQGGIV